MLVTEFGIVTDVIFVAFLNAYFGIEVIPGAKITAQVQPEKALYPMLLTELPIVTSVSPEQPSKAESPMPMTESGIIMLVRPEHP